MAAFCDSGNPKMCVHFSIFKLHMCVCVYICALMIPGSLKILKMVTRGKVGVTGEEKLGSFALTCTHCYI